jgi:DNA primase
MSIFDILNKSISFENVARDHGLEFNRNHKAQCPFHPEKTPSFHNYGTHAYCFGCGQQADAIGLEAHFTGLSQFEAGLSLAKRYRIQLPEFSPKDKEKVEKQIEAYKLIERFAIYANKQIKKLPEVLEFLGKKGLNEDDIDRYKIGYVGDENPVTNKLTKKAHIDLAKEIGLIGEYSDHFRNRIVLPVWSYGRVVFLSGRALPDGNPKYLHLKNSELVYKQIAFSENLRNENCVIAEGITDALAFIKVGIPACALLGTNLGQHAREILSKTKAKLFFCLDKDQAGEIAVYKLAKGFKGYTIDLGFEKDPDEVLAEIGCEEFKKVAGKAIDEAHYYLGLIIKNETIKEALKEIAKLEFASDQELWLKKLSVKNGTTFESLKEDIAKLSHRIKHKKGQKGDDSVWGGNFRDTLQNFQSSLDGSGQKVSYYLGHRICIQNQPG